MPSSGLYRLLAVCMCVSACSLAPRIPTVDDAPLEALVREEAAKIVEVTDDRDEFPRYRFLLSRFPRRDILGMSTGNRRIYVSYDLADQAFKDSRYRWLLRQILAHEIAHEIAGHAKRSDPSFNPFTFGQGVTSEDVGLPRHVRFRHYSTVRELEADRNGMTYWARLDWDCRIWVRILQRFSHANYAGDIFHPTEQRLKLAVRACLPESDTDRIAIEERPGGPQRQR